ncbi:MAG: hypothetical protein P4L87_03020 [Formivibrio sp.]|nr:hypothetical protein [Formivibrio sp.]
MEQIKNVLAAIQRGAAVHPAELAQAQAELAHIEQLLHLVGQKSISQQGAAETNDFLQYLSAR